LRVINDPAGFIGNLRIEYFQHFETINPDLSMCGGSVDMDRKAMIREYKETPRPMGIFQIRNKANGKVSLAPAVMSRPY